MIERKGKVDRSIRGGGWDEEETDDVPWLPDESRWSQRHAQGDRPCEQDEQVPCEKKCRSSGRATKRNARHGSHLVTIDAGHEHSNRINGRTRYHVKEGPKIHQQNNVVTERKEPSAKTLCLHE